MWNATGPDSNRNAPPGIVPDYNHPEDVFWTLNIVLAVICAFFTAVFFFIRVYVKRTIHRHIGVEDCTYRVWFIDQADRFRDMRSSICTSVFDDASSLMMFVANSIDLCYHVYYNSVDE